MDVRHIEYVLAVAEHGSFTAAARACFVAQPSLSQAVRGVERELGVALFHRTRAGAVPTPAGEAFVERGRTVVRAMEGLHQVGPEATGLLTGRLDLVALPTLFDLAAQLVGQLRRAHPGVTVHLAHPENVDDLLDRIVGGRSEVGLVELPVRRRGLVATEVGHQELVLVGHAGTLPDGRSALGGSELRDLPLIAPPPGTSIRGLVEQAWARAGHSPQIVVQTEQREAIGPMAAAGAGVAVLPRGVAEQLAGQHGMVVRRLRPALDRRIGLVHRSGPLSPAAGALSASLSVPAD